MECGPSQAEEEHRTSPPVEVNDDTHDESSRKKQSAAGPLPSLSSFDSVESLREWLADDICTERSFVSPWGGRVPLVYADHTASNRPLKSIETYLQNVCLPLYGNTHTNTSLTGSQSTAFVAEARQIVAEATNAKITGKASTDVVLFVGSGATAAVELLIDCLGLTTNTESARTATMASEQGEKQRKRPIVFVGPYEHNSNLIPWRESGCEIVMIPECTATHSVDLEALERQLAKNCHQGRLKMGTFTAASNVTGKLCDVDAIASLLKKYNALAFFDYATASSYVKMDMNPVGGAAKDAIFLSPHKILGGVGTPGILVVKKHLVSQVNAPKRSGGGTVFYVTEHHHRFLSHRVARYEGGTPMIPGILRAGLTFLLKRQVDRQVASLLNSPSHQNNLLDRDTSTRTYAVTYLKEHAPEMVVLGADDPGPHLPIISFLVRCEERFLHYNFVCALLNDVFGIQSRGGCQCAGPYSQILLGLHGKEANVKIEKALYTYKEKAELLRPGYTRVSLPFKGMRNAEMDYVLQALVWVAKHGWALLCHYRCNHRTGEWRHSSRQGRPLGREERRWLNHFQIGRSFPEQSAQETTWNTEEKLALALENANQILTKAMSDSRATAEAAKMVDADHVLGDAAGEEGDLEELRWYVYPQECAKRVLRGDSELTIRSTVLRGALAPQSAAISEITLDGSEDDSNCTKKRKKPSAVVVPDRVYSFRDGGRKGEASISEISRGVDDEELTRQCEIFDPETDGWVLLEQYRAPGKDDEPTVPTDQDNAARDTPRTAGEKKKAPRTQCDWGVKADVSYQNFINNELKPVPVELSNTRSRKRFLHEIPPPKMMRLANQAIVQWNMITEGDKLLLGLSGGKDSLSLLHCLLEFKRKMPISFELEVCTVDPMTTSFDPSPLIPYVESLGLKYHYLKEDIVDRANEAGGNGKMVTSLCAYCARMKRGLLYSCARKNKCNKLVLAQHLDDCAESVMMSMMHNGLLRTMKANYPIEAGDLCVVRPLVYCRESLMTDFAKKSNLPVINENCPACFEEPKERARVKKMLSREETLYPNVYDNIRRALMPLMHDDALPILRSITEEALARSRKDTKRPKVPDATAMLSSPTLANEAASALLKGVTDDDMLRELARRRGRKKIATVHTNADDQVDTQPSCSIACGPGNIPCYEIME